MRDYSPYQQNIRSFIINKGFCRHFTISGASMGAIKYSLLFLFLEGTSPFPYLSLHVAIHINIVLLLLSEILNYRLSFSFSFFSLLFPLFLNVFLRRADVPSALLLSSNALFVVRSSEISRGSVSTSRLLLL